MEKDFLERCLAEGMSLAAIGDQEGLDATTVGYWLAKHGLTAAGHARHRARGAIPRTQLETLVNEGLTTREIAERVDRSQGTIRHWLREYGLKTTRAARRGLTSSAAAEKYELRECGTHGEVLFVREGRGYYRCTRCRMDRVAARRRRLKETLVPEAGGVCVLCGYDRYIGALEFHHVDPRTKSFGLGSRGLTRSIARLRVEAMKCVLLVRQLPLRG